MSILVRLYHIFIYSQIQSKEWKSKRFYTMDKNTKQQVYYTAINKKLLR